MRTIITRMIKKGLRSTFYTLVSAHLMYLEHFVLI